MKVSKEAGSDELWLGDKFTKDLPVQLSEVELEAKAREMASAQVKLNRLEAIKKRWVKRIGDKLKPVKATVEHAAPIIESGIEQRAVPVRWRQELGASSAVLVRLDTYEVIEETRRAINPDELDGLQNTFGFGRAGGPAPEETPPALLDEVLAQSVALGRAEQAPPLDFPGHTLDAKPVGRATADYRKAPVNANRGKEMCATEEEHEYRPPDAEGWQACRKCPADRRIVATYNLTDTGEEDLSVSQAALDALDAGPKEPAVRWPLGDTQWHLSIEDDRLWFHSPETASASSRRHGPGGWVPTNHGTERIISWTFGGNGELREVPLTVIALAVGLLDEAPEGLVLPRSLAEVKRAIAAERKADMEKWDEEEIAAAARKEEDGPDAREGTVLEEVVPELSDLAEAFLLALLDGPLTLDAIRAKTKNRRPGATANNLKEKGLVEEVDAEEVPAGRFKLTAAGRKAAEVLKAARSTWA